MIDFLVWAAILQGILLSIVYLTSSKHKSYSNRVLGLFLLALIWEAILIFAPDPLLDGYQIFKYFGLPESKMFLPGLFFLYIISKLRIRDKYFTYIKAILALAFIIVGFTLVNLILYLVSNEQLEEVFSRRSIEVVYMGQQSLACVLSAVFVILSSIELKKYQKEAVNETSDMSHSNIQWLWQFIYSMAIVVVLWGAELIRVAMGGIGGNSAVVLTTWALLFIFIYFTSYKAFVNKDLFEIHPEELKKPLDVEKAKQKSESSIADEEVEKIIQALEHIMEMEQLYLESDLSIHDLSKQVEISARKISISIKKHYGSNFSEWVNQYRVNRAKKLLKNYSLSNYTIEGIGYDAGFNSRSAMYLAFKKITGQTPGKFKA